MKRIFAALLVAALVFPATLTESAENQATDPLIYFVMIDRFENGDETNDRGGLVGDRTITGFDPTDFGFFHGGDLVGLERRLDYIASLGFTAIWITPVARQVPLSPNAESAAYHGYWGAGFDEVDARLGTMSDMKRLVSAAHEKGLKVFLDVVVNHTGDVISYEEGESYLSLADHPYRTKDGKRFNAVKLANSEQFPRLDSLDTQTSFPKTVVVSDSIRKSPAWLNDPRNYHNRGNFTSSGEASTFGDFYGLDDLFTESPVVAQGWIDVFSDWIRDVGIDGFRLDTFKHVNVEFWQDFLPEIRRVAAEQGKEYFPMWGEIYDSDPGRIVEWTKRTGLTEVLDFPVQGAIAGYVIEESAKPLAQAFDNDDLYTTPNSDASSNGTFLGNHDMGRIGGFIYNRYRDPQVALKKLEIAHALLYTVRGNPIVYYGDEFGLIGGRDKSARQSLFATQVKEWQSEPRIGMDPIGSRSYFDVAHPMQEVLREVAALRKKYPELRSGYQDFIIANDGLLVMKRVVNGRELLLLFNASRKAIKFRLKEYQGFERERGEVNISGSQVNVPALTWSVFSRALDARVEQGKITLLEPRRYVYDPSILFLRAQVSGIPFAKVRFEYRAKGSDWKSLGSDSSPIFGAQIYRIAPPMSSLPQDPNLRLRAVATSVDGSEVRSRGILLRLPK